MTRDNRVVEQLRGVAARLTGDHDLQKDLLQEMSIHLVQVETDRPGQTPSWYVHSCQFRARHYLACGRSVDSIKRRNNLVPLDQSDDGDDSLCVRPDAAAPVDLHSELITRDIVDLLLPQLTEMQQQILFLLIHGFGVREIARELKTTHPTVIKHRKKIALIASSLLTDTGCIGSHAIPTTYPCVAQTSRRAPGECAGVCTPRSIAS